MLEMIAAVSINGVIGDDNKMLWHLKEDLLHFKELTEDKLVIMGKNTWLSIGSKPLKNRTNVVVTHDKDFKVPEGVYVCNTLDQVDAFMTVHAAPAVIIGGEQLYREYFFKTDTLYLTVIRKPYIGDKFFPYWGQLEKYFYNDKVETYFSKELDCEYDFQRYHSTRQRNR